MSLLHSKLRHDEQEKAQIAEKVATAYIKPSDTEQEKAAEVIRIISEKFADKIISNDISEIQDELRLAIQEECSKLNIDYEEQKRIEKTALMTALGHGPIEEFLEDESVTEIVVQRYDNIVIERNGKIEKVDAVFNNEDHLVTIIQRIVQRVGRQINVSNPIVDARLEDGSRVNATLKTVSPDGATLTIRKFNHTVLSGRDYIQKGSLNREMLYFLERCVRGKVNILVSGGTGTGKTTLLNMLSSFIPNDELIITIEDTLELKLQQPNVRRMEVRLSRNKEMMQIDQKELVKAALRQRPDRIILGEARDGSIVDLISAMSTGHEGSMSTIHANSPRNAVDVRTPILYSMNEDTNFSEESVAMQIAEALQIIVQISRFPDGSRKITHISHVDGLSPDGKVNVKDIYRYNKREECFEFTGYYPKKIIRFIKDKNLEFENNIFRTKEVES